MSVISPVRESASSIRTLDLIEVDLDELLARIDEHHDEWVRTLPPIDVATTSARIRQAAAGLVGISTIVPTLLTQGGWSNATSGTSSSITIAAGDFVVLQVDIAAGTGVVGTITPSGAGQTWLKPSDLNPRFPDITPDSGRRMAVFYAIGVSGSGGVTVSAPGGGAATDGGWIISKFAGVDMTNPFAYGTMLGTGPNSNTPVGLTLYVRKFLDPTYDAGLYLCLAGNSDNDVLPDTGWTQIGKTNSVPSSISSIGMHFKLGESLLPKFTWSTSASNLGIFLELRANGVAPNPAVETFTIAKAGTGSNATSYTFVAPTYASAHPIYLVTVGMRTGSNPLARTVTGGGVTWVNQDSQLFDDGAGNLYRIQLLRAMGPLNGTDVVIACGETQIGNDSWMVAAPGADTSGTNGSGSILQVVKAALTATAVPSVTPSSAGAVFMAGATTGGGSSTVRAIPGNGFATADHRDQQAGTEPLHGSPNCRLYVQFIPFDATTASFTFDSTGNTGEIGWVVKAA